MPPADKKHRNEEGIPARGRMATLIGAPEAVNSAGELGQKKKFLNLLRRTRQVIGSIGSIKFFFFLHLNWKKRCSF